MMDQPAAWQQRTEQLLGKDAVERLSQARVLVVGVGGVGGYAAEMLCRNGIGHLTLIDADAVAASNINRQIIATHSTIGKAKVILFAQRLHDINPEANITAIQEFVTPDNVPKLLEPGFDFVIDAIDTVAPKVALINHALRYKIPIISSMGAGGRVDPTAVIYTDLWSTREDGLARAVRQRLKKAGLHRPLPVVASTEAPHTHSLLHINERNKRTSYGTVAAIPAIFGIFLAQFVINKLSAI